MSKVVAIFGAGPGPGIAVARRFGREGYSVALVSRRQGPLDEFARLLRSEGIVASAFAADLSDPDAVAGVVEAIRAEFGTVDVAYYSPASSEAFLPASEMTVAMMRERIDLCLHGLVAVVNAVLPGMRERGSGAILAGFGGTAAVGLPYMSGPAPAQAAARNYLFSLHGELANVGIRVGMVTVSGAIAGSAYHQSMEAGESDTPPGLEIPVVSADELAERLWQSAAGTGDLETFHPA